jgi:GT2 family glycosyltransferase
MSISIVTPSFNQGAFLEQTIRSVITSTTPPDEYFVIDGGSTDQSVSIIEKYQDKISAWVSEKDTGQANAINKGMKIAASELVGWLNSDDVYLPHTLERVLKVFEENPDVVLVYGDVLSIDERGDTINIQRFKQYELADLMAFNIISQPAVFFRRKALAKAGYLDEQYHYLLDHILWLKIALQGKIYYIPQVLAAARYHPQAKNVAHTSEFGKEAFHIVDWMKDSTEYKNLFAQNKKAILSGAHRFNAYYLLEGNNVIQALNAYWEAIIIDPSVALKEIRRIGFAILSLLGFHSIKNLYKKIRRKKFHDNKLN